MYALYSFICFLCTLFIYVFWSNPVACEILILWPAIKPVPLTLEVWNLNHLTSREVVSIYLKKHQFLRQTSLCLNLDFGTTLHMGFLSLDFFFFKVGINGWFI